MKKVLLVLLRHLGPKVKVQMVSRGITTFRGIAECLGKPFFSTGVLEEVWQAQGITLARVKLSDGTMDVRNEG